MREWPENDVSMPDEVEFGSCGVGFVVSRQGRCEHDILASGLGALTCVEHRGARAGDNQTGDGAGVMTEIPWGLLNLEPGRVAVATLFLSQDERRRRRALEVFEDAFAVYDLIVESYREVPVRPEVLGPIARDSMPVIRQAVIRRPRACRTQASFEGRLYTAKQMTRTKLRRSDSWFDLYFTSLSTRTIVYKSLCRSEDLSVFFPDLANARYETRFCLFHRRFSTNTRTSWDKAQPLRTLAHNGEINTIAGNRSWAYSREQALGLSRDGLLTHQDISDSGNLNEMAEALRFRSSIPRIEEVLSIMIPPADEQNAYYDFWGRAMEPWDGPALISYADGEVVGARLDRNGFRPARWMMSEDRFYLASEAGIFDEGPAQIVEKGTLRAGSGVTVLLDNGKVHFRDPSASRENAEATFNARLFPIESLPEEFEGRPKPKVPKVEEVGALHGVTTEELSKVLAPMIASGKEPIASMGDTARLAVLSDERRSFFDFFYQAFAQVTNPPLDYLRERTVTDLRTELGKRPNVFAPKELIPPTPAISLESPVLSLEQMAMLRGLKVKRPSTLRILARELDCTFARAAGPDDMERRLADIAHGALAAIEEGHSLLILSDRAASADHPPIPSLLALRAVVNVLNREGLRLEASIVVDAADIRTTHELACAIGFGATAVCPWLVFALAEQHEHRSYAELDRATREAKLRQALEAGLLKIMSKMGISVVRSYQSSKLFSAVGLGPRLLREFFPGLASRIGGYELEDVARLVLEHTESVEPGLAQPSRHLLMEHPRGATGERHSMYAARSKVVHRLVRGREDRGSTEELWREYEAMGREVAPVNLRHLLRLRPAHAPLELDEVEPSSSILRRFGSGAMSYGAISAETQRDLFKAMRAVGGRCNSGEGGENPYYFIDGTTATTKQVASARFGVTAEYLIAGDEIEIKIAQGAKPGEGGQLMGVKVDEGIAQARHATPGVDLISPPPLHDIYSIEDLKQLIYELKQLHPSAKVCVKLVAGRHVGTVAVGVVKAGADVIQISGGDGGTGAAPISSMRHAGMPFELGLAEVHRRLTEHDLRRHVRLRVDGGLSTAEDIVVAAALGAEEFGFGKLLLVAQGCIMARICEKNRCPTGIATHDPKFKAKYKGEPEHVVSLLEQLAEGVRSHLSKIGVRRLDQVIGDTSVLELAPDMREIVRRRRLQLSELLHARPRGADPLLELQPQRVNALNEAVLGAARKAVENDEEFEGSFDIRSTDRAVPARLSGWLAERARDARLAGLPRDDGSADRAAHLPAEGRIALRFRGSAGQGFGAFLVQGVDIRLEGEANDSVCKSMSGGRVILHPDRESRFEAETNVILGNCALYGATGGLLLVRGRAGDRFAVRNSGARTVIEGAGLHACEYMTGGTVVVLGAVEANAGAGMTGGELFMQSKYASKINAEYIEMRALDDSAAERLHGLLELHLRECGSERARAWLADWEGTRATVGWFVPRAR